MNFKPFFTAAVCTAMMGLAGGVAGVGQAQAATLRARFGYTNYVPATIASPSITGNVGTVKFNWARMDAPAPGVDATLAPQFNSFCVEIGQPVSANTEYTFNVLSPEQAGWSDQRSRAMRTLFADHFADITGSDTNAAFQLAVWELVYDADHDLSSGSFRASSPAAPAGIAQGWLSGLDDENPGRALPNISILSHPNAQDQVTVLIPAPGAAACAMVGLMMLGGRRRR